MAGQQSRKNPGAHLKHLLRFTMTVLLMMTGLASVAMASTKRALIIGNAGYLQIGLLDSPYADAQAYASLFIDHDYILHDGAAQFDLNYRTFRSTFEDFAGSIEPGDNVIFVFSGHGWSGNTFDGRTTNYLGAVDASGISRDSMSRVSGISIDEVIRVLHEKAGPEGHVLIIVDACRNDPDNENSSEFRFAPMGAFPIETTFAFSAQPGQTSLESLGEDDDNPLSLFTRVFIDAIREGGTYDAIKQRTIARVEDLARERRGHEQRPFMSANVRRGIEFEPLVDNPWNDGTLEAQSSEQEAKTFQASFPRLASMEPERCQFGQPVFRDALGARREQHAGTVGIASDIAIKSKNCIGHAALKQIGIVSLERVDEKIAPIKVSRTTLAPTPLRENDRIQTMIYVQRIKGSLPKRESTEVFDPDDIVDFLGRKAFDLDEEATLSMMIRRGDDTEFIVLDLPERGQF